MTMSVDVNEIHLYRDNVYFRKAINDLIIIVEQQIQCSPFVDALLVFCNKSNDKHKVLYWDKTSLAFV